MEYWTFYFMVYTYQFYTSPFLRLLHFYENKSLIKSERGEKKVLGFLLIECLHSLLWTRVGVEANYLQSFVIVWQFYPLLVLIDLLSKMATQ